MSGGDLQGYPVGFRGVAILYDSWKGIEQLSYRGNLWRFFLSAGSDGVRMRFKFEVASWCNMLKYVESVSNVDASEVWRQVTSHLIIGMPSETVDRWDAQIKLNLHHH